MDDLMCVCFFTINPAVLDQSCATSTVLVS